MSQRRTAKIDGELQRLLGEIFLTEMKDPRFSKMAGVTRVAVTPDLKYQHLRHAGSGGIHYGGASQRGAFPAGKIERKNQTAQDPQPGVCTRYFDCL